MKIGRVSALALVAALALPLHAQAASQGFSYSGFYGGVDLGASAITNTASWGAVTIDQGTTAVTYGGHAGYGVQFQNPWYIGGEFGFGGASGKINLNDGSQTIGESENWSLSLDARLGRVVDHDTLIYGKLGWAHTDFNQTWNVLGYSGSADKGFDGVRFGGGVESLIGDGLAGRIEGIYTAYGSQTSYGVTYSPSSVGAVAGLSYYFN